MGKHRKRIPQRQAKVTKMKKGDTLRIEYVAAKTGAVVLKYPPGGTVTLEKSTSVLHVAADVP